MSATRLVPPASDSIVGASLQLGTTDDFVRQCIREGKLKTVTPPGSKRARVLQSSIDDMYREIYSDALRAG